VNLLGGLFRPISATDPFRTGFLAAAGFETARAPTCPLGGEDTGGFENNENAMYDHKNPLCRWHRIIRRRPHCCKRNLFVAGRLSPIGNDFIHSTPNTKVAGEYASTRLGGSGSVRPRLQHAFRKP
jgi:hypothetical protein